MLGHPGVIEAERFYLGDLLEQAAIEIWQSPVYFGHVSRKNMRAEFHSVIRINVNDCAG
jgi:hypothetical protein